MDIIEHTPHILHMLVISADILQSEETSYSRYMIVKADMTTVYRNSKL